MKYGVYLSGIVNGITRMYPFIFPDEDIFDEHVESNFEDIMDLFPEELDDSPEVHSYFNVNRGIPYGAIELKELIEKHKSLKNDQYFSKEEEKEEESDHE